MSFAVPLSLFHGLGSLVNTLHRNNITARYYIQLNSKSLYTYIAT